MFPKTGETANLHNNATRMYKQRTPPYRLGESTSGGGSSQAESNNGKTVQVLLEDFKFLNQSYFQQWYTNHWV